MDGREMERLAFRSGDVIFLEGTRSPCMYYVCSGKVGIYSGYGKEGEKLLTTLGPGSFFGEMGMVRGFPRSATAVAMQSDTVAAVVTWETLSSFFQAEPAKVVGIMQQMANRIAELSDDYIGACGEITRLVEERNGLRAETARLSQAAAQVPQSQPMTAGGPSAAGTEWNAPTVPVQRGGAAAKTAPSVRKPGKPQNSEEARLKKYLDAYRRYTNEKNVINMKLGDEFMRI